MKMKMFAYNCTNDVTERPNRSTSPAAQCLNAMASDFAEWRQPLRNNAKAASEKAAQKTEDQETSRIRFDQRLNFDRIHFIQNVRPKAAKPPHFHW